jgi:hypothetical protein
MGQRAGGSAASWYGSRRLISLAHSPRAPRLSHLRKQPFLKGLCGAHSRLAAQRVTPLVARKCHEAHLDDHCRS